LRLRIISGQHIPKPDQSTEGEVVDPYVKVKMVGMDIDQREYKTKDIHDNGTNFLKNFKSSRIRLDL
jgi:phosphatidylinositol phospholipase C, delta